MTIEITNNKQIEEVIENGKKIISNDMNNKRNIIKRIVKDICKTNERALEDDLILYIEYLKVSGYANVEDDGSVVKIIMNKKDIEKGFITKPESVSRCRRELRNSNEIIYDEETDIKREQYSKEHKEYYKKEDKEFYNDYNKRRDEWV